VTAGRAVQPAAVLMLAGLLVLAAVLLWKWLLLAGVARLAWRRLYPGRRRPKSSWSSLGRTAAMLFAAWNSRWLKPQQLRASVPARAGAEHVCGDCGRPWKEH